MADLLEPLRPALADRYLIERELGRGGMAIVYLAEDRRHQRKVALKVLRPEIAQSLGGDRFLREIQLAARLNHPNILALHDSGESDGVLWYTMPYVEGESLRDRLTRDDQLPIEDALRITKEVAEGLEYAHAQGVVHRDIKPENILLANGHAVIADFGIAKAVTEAGGERLTETGIAVGTPAYMSPEQGAGSGKLDGRSDLYSLGCVLYEMLTGETPYTAPSYQALLAKKLSEPVPHVSVVRETVPASVEAALAKALAKNPVDRFRTAAEFTAALSASAPEAPHPRRPRRAILAAVTVVTVAAVAGWQYRRATADPGPPAPDRPYTVLATPEGSADSTVRDMVEYLLRSGLDMAHVVQTVPAVEVERFLTLMDRPTTTVLDDATARELAERYGVPTVVLPRVDGVGNGFVIAVRVEDVASGHLRAEARRQAANPDAVVEAVDAVAREILRDLGETRAALANRDRLPDVMTSSLSALRKYRDAIRLVLMSDYRQALPLLREAVAEDTAFAMAWAALRAVDGRGQGDSSRAAVERALRFPDRLTEARRNDIEGFRRMEDDIALWDEGLDLVCRGFPRNCALALSWFGFVDSAFNIEKHLLADSVRRVRALDPSRSFEWCWHNTWEYAASTARVMEWRGFLDSLGVITPPSCAPRYEQWTSLAAGDWDRAESVQPQLAYLSFPLDVVRGRIAAAREAPTAETWGVPTLILELVYGIQGPIDDVELTGREWGPVHDYARYGLRSALLGDTSEAKRVQARLRALRDSATSDRFEGAYGPWFALMEAGPAVRREDWTAVIDVLGPWAERARKPGYGLYWREAFINGGHSYLTWWLLAEAYTQLGRLDSAIVHLESVVGPPLIDWYYYGVPYPAAHFKLGQLYAQKADREQALQHYSAFLDTFTDPDPEYVWMVTEARSEVERLGRGR